MNPDWNNQVKIRGGRSDTGAWHRALVVARHLFETGRWPDSNKTTIVIHDPYETHYRLSCRNTEPELDKDYHFAPHYPR